MSSIIIPPLGWKPFEERTDAENMIHNAIVRRMPSFSLPAMGKPEVGTKVLFTDLWRHPKALAALGFDFIGWHQFTGSCVGVGGGNAAQTLIMIDALIRNELEKIILYFWPYNYGRSRLLGGMRGEGEGSFGSTFSQSLEQDGGTAWLKELGCPDFSMGNGMEIGARAERTWSDGNEANAALRAEAVKHKFISAPLSSGEQVRDAIMNGYPVTRAFSTFVNPETATVRNGVLLGRYNGRGGHQESWLGYWHHPQNGELIYEMNQWGLNAYGKDPGGGADGGCWLSIDEVDRQCRNGEIYALSQYDGYPAQPDIPKLMNWGDIWS